MPHISSADKKAYMSAYRSRPDVVAKERHRGASRAAAVRADKSRIINESKNRPCCDCGVRYPPWVMDFDHVRGVKLFNIAAAKLYQVGQALLDEIAKCDVVCANCHRERSHQRTHGDPDV